MENNFSNKNIIVTGGSSGIGSALVKELLNLGANVWIIARNEDKIKELQNQLVDKHQLINYYLADVRNLPEIEAIAHQLRQEGKVIDGLINSAGVAEPAEFGNMGIEKYHWLMDVNYFGTVHCVMAFLPLLGAGSFIVNISSIAGYLGVYGYSAYGASKYAVRGFSDILRSELKPKNIFVSIVFPPDTQTPQLAYEEQFKPAITKKIAGSAAVMSPEKVAHEIIKGINKKKYLIFPGFESKFFYHLSNFLGPLVYPLMDFMVSRAMKESNPKKQSD
ncbi:MAG: SDR family oxidoreductase [Anaerolineaceae bacterium]|jgi:3-dehydrosphinganine reductase|nr:SDR family oxidoreductase [Anaerolineaceae bacterium]